MIAGEIDGYQYAVIESTSLIAVRRPDGSLRMLPGAGDVEAAVRRFVREDLAQREKGETSGAAPSTKP